ncbi:MAG: type II toxin-antitoxin system VapC family toxin [Rhizobiaceae bacterium]
MLVVDTSVWIDYFRGTESTQAALLDREISQTRIIVPDLVLAEILRGLPNETIARQIEQQLQAFHSVTIGGAEIAIKTAANYRRLRSLGMTVRGTIDLLIATWCVENEIPLLHSDRDFTTMQQHMGLQILSS